MKNQIYIASILIVIVLIWSCSEPSEPSSQQATAFQGKGGIYYLGTSDVAIKSTAYTNPNIAGTVVRVRWGSLEYSADKFNWTYIDGELAKAKANNKRIVVQLLGYPQWVITDLGATAYNYIDLNSNHSTYLDTLQDVLPYDDIYLARIENLINHLAERYTNESTISYFNLVSGQISRGMPESVITENGKKSFWTEFDYNADEVVAKMKPILDLYMAKFKNTPLWNSIDYVSFEKEASGRGNNYLASQYAAYGIEKYPDRFGCWREDISGCNPNPGVSSTSQWYIMEQNMDRTGAQKLWNVQDGPDRMNKCGITPNTKEAVLSASFENGLRLGMRYFEVYGADVDDTELAATISKYDQILKEKYAY